jgi:hypothetical protein
MMVKIEIDWEEMMARMDTNHERMNASLREEIKSWQAEMRSIVSAWIVDMNDCQKETKADWEATEAKPEKVEPNSENMEAIPI